DVDAELERVRRDDTAYRTVAQPALDGATLRRQIAAAIATNEVLRPLRLRKARAQIGEQELRLDARARERDGLHAGGEQRRRDVAAGHERALAHAEVAIHDRRIDEDQHLLAARGTGVVDDDDVVLYVLSRELVGVRDRRRGADEYRMRTVELADAAQPAQHVRDVA